MIYCNLLLSFKSVKVFAIKLKRTEGPRTIIEQNAPRGFPTSVDTIELTATLLTPSRPQGPYKIHKTHNFCCPFKTLTDCYPRAEKFEQN